MKHLVFKGIVPLCAAVFVSQLAAAGSNPIPPTQAAIEDCIKASVMRAAPNDKPKMPSEERTRLAGLVLADCEVQVRNAEKMIQARYSIEDHERISTAVRASTLRKIFYAIDVRRGAKYPSEDINAQN